MAVSGIFAALVLGALVAFIPAAEAASCKSGKSAKAGKCKVKAPARSTATAKRAGKKPKARPAGTASKNGLAEFTESGGCRILASEAAVRRMREIVTNGTVVWDGKCVDGLISGSGVLRQEGVSQEGGRSKRFAYYFSGTALNGRRTGRWTRETFDRFVDSPLSWTSLARVDFVDGVSKGAPKPIPVQGTDRHTESFQSRILVPESKLAQEANAASAESLPPLTIAESLSRKPDAAAPVATVLAPPAPQAPPPRVVAVLAAPTASVAAPAPSAAVPVPTISPPPPLPVRTATAAAPATTAPESGRAKSAPAPAAAAAPAVANLSAARPASTERAARLTLAMPASIEGQTFGFGTGCYMDTLDGQLWEGAVLTAKDRMSIRINGWAVDDEGKNLPEATYLRFEHSSGRRFYAETRPDERPDVARHFGVPAFARAGYRAVVSAEGLPSGEYEVVILMSVGGRNILCGNGRKLRL